MAVTQAIIPMEGRVFCLLFDSEADSIEVVHQDGFAVGQEPGMVDFYPSYYHEAVIKGWVPLMVRRRKDTDVLVGLMVEHVSSQFPGRWWRRRQTIPELIEMLLRLALDRLGGEQTEPLMESPRRYSDIDLVLPDELERVPTVG